MQPLKGALAKCFHAVALRLQPIVIFRLRLEFRNIPKGHCILESYGKNPESINFVQASLKLAEQFCQLPNRIRMLCLDSNFAADEFPEGLPGEVNAGFRPARSRADAKNNSNSKSLK